MAAPADERSRVLAHRAPRHISEKASSCLPGYTSAFARPYIRLKQAIDPGHVPLAEKIHDEVAVRHLVQI
jgi:hypothetical protein